MLSRSLSAEQHAQQKLGSIFLFKHRSISVFVNINKLRPENRNSLIKYLPYVLFAFSSSSFFSFVLTNVFDFRISDLICAIVVTQVK